MKEYIRALIDSYENSEGMEKEMAKQALIEAREKARQEVDTEVLMWIHDGISVKELTVTTAPPRKRRGYG